MIVLREHRLRGLLPTLSLASSAASNLTIRDRSVAFVDFGCKLPISLNIFSADEPVHGSLLKAIRTQAAPIWRCRQAQCLVADILLDFARPEEEK